ncbi:hypothetical protein CTI12_AA211880 [Artemisia annua]|uniref:Uncharacterized protein n=1 Tax=Artemisia annua TaxID=35608 RepID=A0A2U1NZM4_ARTAN|nr:hypothetical protein CTI12_AA211880 [Artemisia annua]
MVLNQSLVHHHVEPLRGLMEVPLDVVFKIHYNGIFMFDPLRYVHCREILMEASSSDRIMFSRLLDILLAKIRQNIWAVFICILLLDIESGGLKIIERYADVHALYDLAKRHKTVEVYIAHSPQKLAPYYHNNLSLDGSDSEVTSKRKQHDKLKKDAGNMTVDELVSWAEEEAQSPYLRSPPLKERPLINDYEGKVWFQRMWHNDDDGGYDYPFLTDDEVYKIPQKNDANQGVENRAVDDFVVENVENEVVKMVTDELVSNRVDEVNPERAAETITGNTNNAENLLVNDNDVHAQNDDDLYANIDEKPQQGNTTNVRRGTGITIRENTNPNVSSDSESESDDYNVRCGNQSDGYESYESSGKSDKSYDYLSNGEDEQLKGKGDGISDPFTILQKSKPNDDSYPIYDDETHWRLKKPILGQKYPNVEKTTNQASQEVNIPGTQQSQVVGTSKKSTNVVTRSRRTTEDDIVETRIISSAARGGRKKSIARGGRATTSVRGGSSAMHGRLTRSGLQQRPAISTPPVAVHDPIERAPTQEQA